MNESDKWVIHKGFHEGIAMICVHIYVEKSNSSRF